MAVATTAQRGKRHPQYFRHVAANPETTREYWAGIFTVSRFPPLQPPPPTSSPASFFTTNHINAGIAAVEDRTPGEDGLLAKVLTFLHHTRAAEPTTNG